MGLDLKPIFMTSVSAEEYWISGANKNGADGLYGPRPTPMDPDVREEYWTINQKTAEQSPPQNHLDSLPWCNKFTPTNAATTQRNYTTQLRILLCQPSRRTISFPSYRRVRKYQP